MATSVKKSKTASTSSTSSTAAKSKSDNSTTTKKRPAATGEEVKKKKKPKEFAIAPELMGSEFNQVRRPRLPYGFILNDKPAGIFIPLDQLEECQWINIPEEDELHSASPTGKEIQGLLLTEARFSILASTEEYIRYKKNEEELGELSGTIIGSYEENKSIFNKKTMDACADHAIIFLDEDNQPLHSIPLTIRFRNVALWAFKSEFDKYFRALERAYASFTGERYSGKTDEWRSFGVINAVFTQEKQGTGSNKSWCCKPKEIEMPTLENFPSLFLGTPEMYNLMMGHHDSIAGYKDTAIALPAAGETSAKPAKVEIAKNKVKPMKSAKPNAKSADDFEFDDEEETGDTLDELLEDEDEIDVDAEEGEDEESEDEDLELEDEDE